MTDGVDDKGALVEPVLPLFLALGIKEEEGEALLEVEVLLDPCHLPLVLKEHASKVAELPVHHRAVAALAVEVLLAGKLGEVEQGLSALDVAVVGADAHRARVEVDVAVEVEQAVAEHQVDRECVRRGSCCVRRGRRWRVQVASGGKRGVREGGTGGCWTDRPRESRLTRSRIARFVRSRGRVKSVMKRFWLTKIVKLPS